MARIVPTRRNRRIWSNTLAVTGFGESTFAEIAWERGRRASTRWALVGALLGFVVALVAFAPAAWLASSVARATEDRLILADARGTVWSGSAVVVLTGGPGSRDASALPGRLNWTLGLRGLGLLLQARHACCLADTLSLRVQPGFGRLSLTLPAPGGPVGQWPTAWLAGLGTPFNTLQLGGVMRLSTTGLTVESVQGRWRVEGRADLELIGLSSPIATLPTLGSYRVSLVGDPRNPGTAQLTLATVDGALRLAGSGQLGGGHARFRGDASAAPGSEAALGNVLSIIGKRQGARSVISIG